VQQVPHRRRYGAILGWSVYAAALVAVTAWFTFFQFSSAAPEKPQERAEAPGVQEHHTGTVVTRRGDGTGCRHMKFDNSTGRLQEQADTSCVDGPLGTNSTEHRMNAIRDAFSKK
jgi:hypothetical protein